MIAAISATQPYEEARDSNRASYGEICSVCGFFITLPGEAYEARIVSGFGWPMTEWVPIHSRCCADQCVLIEVGN